MRALRAGAVLIVAQWLAAGCAMVPPDRYGVKSVHITGADEMAGGEIEACLATRERDHVDVIVGLKETGDCGEPPFEDDDPPRIRLWAWPWTT